MNKFNAAKTTEDLICWTREWFNKNGKDSVAVIGISGGKDSTIAATILTRALGKDRVIGVMMPNGVQSDIDDSIRVCELLGIKSYTMNIKMAVDAILAQLNVQNCLNATPQTVENLPPRIRMASLYAISQTVNGRVINTCNLSENYLGYATIYGDHAGDVSLFDQLTVTEILQIGDYLGLPYELVHKTPSDGLCGKTDEDNFGFTYSVLDRYIRTGECEDENIKIEIDNRHERNRFKDSLIRFPHFDPEI